MSAPWANTLVVMAKAPRMGGAKTRLAADVGRVHAQRLYRSMVATVLRNVEDPRWTLELRVAPDSFLLGPRPREWGAHALHGQGGGGLSERLKGAMDRRGATCVIGTDCPEVRARDVSDAFAALGRANLVLGPAEDGGFWLIGARGGVRREVFAGVRWSSEHALADVVANVEARGGRVAFLRTLVDVDDGEALRKVRGRGGL